MTKNAFAAIVGAVGVIFLVEPLAVGSPSTSSATTVNTAVATTKKGKDLTVTGNLDVNGNGDVRGSSFSIGSWAKDSSQYGILFSYSDATPVGDPSFLTLTANRPLHEWHWDRVSDDLSTTVPMMKLDSSNRLYLYNPADTTSAVIILDPVAGKVYVNGVALGEAASVDSGDLGLITPMIARGSGSVVFGYGTETYGNQSIAGGLYTTAYGDQTFSMGAYTHADGWASVATGYGSYSTGNLSLSQGNQTRANGGSSVAMGSETTASGDNSTALGNRTTAQGFAQTVVGQCNVIQGTATSWISAANEPVFIVGNGLDPQHPSNAFVVMKNGDATISGAVYINPAGDLPMGAFTSGTHP